MQQPEDLRTTLFVSEREALLGSTRIVTLPGRRRVTFSVPAGVHDGDQIRLEGEGLPSPGGGPPGDLVITIKYRQTQEIASINQPDHRPSSDTQPLEEMPTSPLGRRYNPSSPLPDIEDIPTSPPGSNNVPLSEAPSRDLPPFPFPADGGNVPSPGLQGIGNNAPFPPGGNGPLYSAPLPPGGNFSPLGPPNVPHTPTYPQRHSLLGRPLSRQTVLRILLLLLVIVVSGGTLITAAINQRSNVNALAISTAISATRTAQAGPAFPFSQILLLSDPLKDNSRGNQWEEDGNSNGSCSFSGGNYHASIALQDRFRACIALNFHAGNFTYEVQMQILKGDCGGLIFRRTGARFYYFRVCVDGSYAFIRYTSDANTALNVTLRSGTHPAIHQGLNQANLLAVVASGSKLDLYVNRQLIAGVQDTSYTEGEIGLVAKAKANTTEAVFSNLMVWKL